AAPGNPPPHYYPWGGSFTVTLTVTGSNGYSKVLSPPTVIDVKGKVYCIPPTTGEPTPTHPPGPDDRKTAIGDRDNDGIPDNLDNCPTVPNGDQKDMDHDGLGNVCDSDRDGDGVPDAVDNCIDVSNARQEDLNGD